MHEYIHRYSMRIPLYEKHGLGASCYKNRGHVDTVGPMGHETSVYQNNIKLKICNYMN